MSRPTAAGQAADYASAGPKPVVLVEILSSPALRFTNRGEAASFNGQTYVHRPFQRGTIAVQGFKEIPSASLVFDNADDYFGGLDPTQGRAFAGKRVNVYRLWEGGLGGASAWLDDYVVDYCDRQGALWSFHLKPVAAILRTMIPLRKLTEAEFPGVPREAR